MPKLTLMLLPFVGGLFLGCTHEPKVVFPNTGYQNMVWSAEEQAKPIAIRHLARNELSSAHLIRLQGSEPPHYHDHHNLTVTVLQGKGIIHFKDHEVILKEGDVVTIPQGVYHWAENIDDDASVVFATFSPAYQGKDMRLLK